MNKRVDPKIDIMKGVVNPQILRDEIRACVAGNGNSYSYLRGALNFLSRKPPNPHIVPVLRLAMEKAREV